jgi:uncharacterized peroxidase-related enzyme
MAYIETVPEDEAGGDVAELYESDRRAMGYVANYTKAFSLRPQVMRAWQGLSASIRSTMDLRRYELVTLAAARRLKSSYCSLAHGKILAERFLSPQQTARVVRDDPDAGLDTLDAAIVDFAGKVAADASSIAAADVERLRELGCSDGEVLDIVLTVAARCFFSTVLDATGSLPDAAFAALDDELRDALTVGRSIADA